MHKLRESLRSIKVFFRELSSFSNSDRIGTCALIVIMLAIIVLPMTFDKNETSAEDMEQLKKEMDIFLAEMEKAEQKRDTAFIFDPNTIDSSDLVLLGFSPAQAKTIINYRKKGGKFYNKENFGKSFAVSERMFERLYQYIDIKNEKPQKRTETAKTPRTQKVSSTETPKRQFVAETKPPDKNRIEIELNTADTVALQTLKGIGSYYAKKIVEYRDKLGGFYSVEQLLEIRGIDSARFELFSKQIIVDVLQIKRIDVNKITEANLAKHPYINNYLAKSIMKYRKFKGTITSAEELLKEKILTDKQMEKINLYLEFLNE